jgi:hypothetical protein
MMVDTGKSEVFKWKIPQFFPGLFDSNIAAFNFFQ